MALFGQNPGAIFSIEKLIETNSLTGIRAIIFNNNFS